LSEGQLRLGLVECLGHSLLHPYPVLHEKQGDLVAQVGCELCVRRTSNMVGGRNCADVASVFAGNLQINDTVLPNGSGIVFA
jgi:hypothetical protein